MTKNKFILICLITGSVLIIGLFVYSSRQPQAPGIPQPRIVNRNPQELVIKGAFDESKINLPTELNIYDLAVDTFSLEESKLIASNLGFTQELNTLSDVNTGKIYVWSDEDKSLRIIPSISIIDYKANFSPISTTLPWPDENLLINNAKKFLSDKNLFPQENLELKEVKYLSTDLGEIAYTTKREASVAEIQFTQKINGFPIVNSTAGVGTVNVKLTKTNQIVGLYLDKTNRTTGGKLYKVKDLNQIKSELPQAQIQTYDISRPESGSREISLDLQEITANQIEIAYLKEYSLLQTQLQPIFVIKGIARLNGGVETGVTLYLPAIAN